jgi:hypothetical protein
MFISALLDKPERNIFISALLDKPERNIFVISRFVIKY